MVQGPQNYWKTIDVNGQSAKKHSMVMISTKTIEHCNSLFEIIGIFNGRFKLIEIFNGEYLWMNIIKCFLLLTIAL